MLKFAYYLHVHVVKFVRPLKNYIKSVYTPIYQIIIQIYLHYLHFVQSFTLLDSPREKFYISLQYLLGPLQVTIVHMSFSIAIVRKPLCVCKVMF